MVTVISHIRTRLTALAFVLACVAGLGIATPKTSAATDIIDVKLTDAGFEPAEIVVTVGMPFKLRFENRSSAPAEVESHDLRFEKVVVVGKSVTVRVRPLDAATYSFYNDFKPEMKGQVVAK